ncbi:MAG: hypothetical protein DRZ80_04555 [Thermoprotei archaeon]|nr:MAG: hypothetical protein DRZ80_04555 [Thermoprotei archaeon]
MNTRTGVSPVIAILLLIVIAVAASVLVYLWVTGYIGGISEAANAEVIQDKIKIEGVQKHQDFDRVYLIWVRNIGETKVVLSKIYLLDETGQTVIHMDEYAGEWPLKPGEAQYYWFYIPPDVDIVEGKIYKIKVVTKNGFEAYASFRA